MSEQKTCNDCKYSQKFTEIECFCNYINDSDSVVLNVDSCDCFEEKEYAVLYKEKNCKRIEVYSLKFKTIQEYLDYFAHTKDMYDWIYLIDENGDRVK